MTRVFVLAYTRWRFGRLEYVREHTCRWPVQLSFDF